MTYTPGSTPGQPFGLSDEQIAKGLAAKPKPTMEEMETRLAIVESFIRSGAWVRNNRD